MMGVNVDLFSTEFSINMAMVQFKGLPRLTLKRRVSLGAPSKRNRAQRSQELAGLKDRWMSAS